MQLSKKQKAFSNFFLRFWNVDKILNTFRKKMTLIADVFLKLAIPKNVAKEMSEKSRFRRPFDNQHG